MASSFKKQLLVGVAYTAVAKYIGLVILLIVTAILSRLLKPDDFGIVAIATIFINFFSLISSMGFSPAIIQNNDLSTRDIQNIYSFSFYLGIGLSAVFILISPIIARLYDKDILITILILLSVNIFFSVLNIVPNALIYKNKEFKYIAIRTLWVQSIVGIGAIVSAFAGFGLFSLLINPILGSIIIFIISYRRYPIAFSFKFESISIKKISHFSLYQVLFNIVVLFYNTIDNLLIGRFLGMNALGYYEKSYRLMRLPLDNIGHVISPILQPLLREHQNDISFIREKYYSLTLFLAYVGFILSAFFFFTSKELILIIFGSQWLPSVDSFRLLSIIAGIIIIQAPIGAIFQSANRTKWMFIASLYAVLIVTVAIFIGLNLGSIEWVSACLVPAFISVFIIYNFILHKYVLRHPLLEFLKILKWPFITMLPIALGLFVFSYYMTIENLFISLVSKSFIMMITVIVLYYLGLMKGFSFSQLKS